MNELGFRLRFLKWIKGFAKIVDGVLLIVTFGFVDVGLTTNVNEIYLKEMMKQYGRKKND